VTVPTCSGTSPSVLSILSAFSRHAPCPDDPPPPFPLSSLVITVILVAGVVILVVPSLGHLVLVLVGFSMLELGSCYPNSCRDSPRRHWAGFAVVGLPMSTAVGGWQPKRSSLRTLCLEGMAEKGHPVPSPSYNLFETSSRGERGISCEDDDRGEVGGKFNAADPPEGPKEWVFPSVSSLGLSMATVGKGWETAVLNEGVEA
jgi:hypothetical protein